MKKFLSTAFVLIFFATSTTTFASKLIFGQRAYSSKPIDIRVGDHREKRELGSKPIET